MTDIRIKIAANLAPGRYHIRCKERTALLAICNGHDFAWEPGCEAVSDGNWVTFYAGEKQLWDCNSNYAAANFKCDLISEEEHHA